MTVPVSLPFPGSRALAGWWRQLTPWQLRAWRVGYLFLHRIEALVRVTRPLQPDALHTLILKAVALDADETLDRLEQRLHLSQQIVRRVLRSLTEAGLLAVEAGRHIPTQTGRAVLTRGEYPALFDERQVFYFLEPEQPDGTPHFLPLDAPPTVPLPVSADWRFDPGKLVECTARPADWKRRFGFPTDVEEVVLASEGQGLPDLWRRVVVDRPERLPLVVGLTSQPEGGDRLLGFAFRPDGWLLLADAPLFALADGWQEAFPSLLAGPSAVEWEEAWRTWCQPRGLAASDLRGLQPEDHRLHATVSLRLMDRLRAARSDVLQGEAWLIAGNGRLRAAAQLVLGEPEPRPALRQA